VRQSAQLHRPDRLAPRLDFALIAADQRNGHVIAPPGKRMGQTVGDELSGRSRSPSEPSVNNCLYQVLCRESGHEPRRFPLHVNHKGLITILDGRADQGSNIFKGGGDQMSAAI
jgi:hypothetical protein